MVLREEHHFSAEDRKLPPGLIIRLWFLAGEKERALLVARQTGAFADAVERLACTDVAQARALRRAWAEMLASAGHLSGAVEVERPHGDGWKR